jgi:hypothetical protein
MASFNGFVNKIGIFKVSAATKFLRWNSNFNVIGPVVKRKSKFRGKSRNMPSRSYICIFGDKIDYCPSWVL